MNDSQKNLYIYGMLGLNVAEEHPELALNYWLLGHLLGVFDD